MTDVVSLSTGNTLAGFTAGAQGTVTGSILGLTYSFTLTCKDGSGTTLTTCTALTDNAEANVSWSGTLDLTNFSSSVTRTGDWKVTGLQTATATLTGTGSFTFGATVKSIFRPSTTTYALTADADYDNVQINTANRQIIGGNINYMVTSTAATTGGSADASAKFDIDAKVAFSSTGTATITLDGNHSYAVDESTGVVVKTN